MKKNIKIFIKTFIKKVNLLEDLRMPRLNFKFNMVYIIHKILVLFKNHRNYLKMIFSNAFLRSIIDFYLYFFKKTYNNAKSMA